MLVYNMEQGTDEWLEARKGVFTASQMGIWVTKEKRTKTDDKAAFASICKTLAELSGCEMAPVFPNWAMKRGTELEPLARAAFQEESGLDVEEVGFCVHDNGGFGCSPDGFTNDRKGLVEIKCPLPETHVKYTLNPESFVDTYRIQIHMQMAVTGADYCDCYSFCPLLPSMLLRVERDAFTEDLLRGLIRLADEFKEYKKEMAAKWAEMKKRIEEKV